MVRGKTSKVVIATVLAVCMAVVLVPAAFAQSQAPVPSGLKVGLPTSSDGGVLKLTWNVTSPESITGYKVYRSASPDGGFKSVFSDTADTRLNVMQFMDAGLEPGATYYYRVTLIDSGGKETSPSNVAKGVLPALAGPAPAGGKKQADTREKGKHIIISVTENRIWFLENGVLVRTHLCSTGMPSHPTPLGVFHVEDHEYCAISVKYGGVYMYWWMGFAPDTGMHALPYDPKSGSWTSADCLGYNASHGCVRQAISDAQWAYNWAPNGTRIDVISGHFNYTPPPPPPPPTTGGSGSQGISKLSKDWYFAEGCTTGNFDEYLCMMNPSDKIANVNATYMKPDGSVVGGSYTVQPFARFTVHVNDIPGLDDAEHSTHLSSDVEMAAERSEYFYDYAGGKNGGTDSAGVTAPGKSWYLAEGYTGGDFDEYVLIQNPETTAASVHVQYMKPDGQTVLKNYAVNPTSRMSLHVDDVPELASTDVSTWVTSNIPVVVERAQYFNYYGKDDGNASAAVSSPSKIWYLAEGYTGGDFDEYVLIQNPEATAGKADVTFMCEDGTSVKKEYALIPQSRFTIHVDDIPGLESRSVSTKIEASVGVIAERAEYFTSYGRTGGADAPGVTEPQKYWYLAEGYTGGDFDTYVLVMNPGDEPSNVDVNYLLPGGGIKQANYTVAAHSRYTIHLDEIPGLTNTEVATALTGSQPIICERAMYFSIDNE